MSRPKLAMSTRCFYSALDTLLSIHLWATLMETKFTVTLKFNSSNCNMSFVKLQRTQSLARPTTHAAISTFSTSHNSISPQCSQPLFESCSTKSKPNIPCCRYKLFLKTHFDYQHLIFFIIFPLLPYKLSEEKNNA